MWTNHVDLCKAVQMHNCRHVTFDAFLHHLYIDVPHWVWYFHSSVSVACVVTAMPIRNTLYGLVHRHSNFLSYYIWRYIAIVQQVFDKKTPCHCNMHCAIAAVNKAAMSTSLVRSSAAAQTDWPQHDIIYGELLYHL